MIPQNLLDKLAKDHYWRINNLYYIIDKKGRKTVFTLNSAQEELYHNIWYLNIILKARQLGISTLICLLFLDRCLFNDNMSAGIIAQTREDAEALFKRIKFAYDNLPLEIRIARPTNADSTRELVFSNGSSLRVGTSMRGSTLQYLHISEFGKICAKYPEKAEEIITGSLNTVAPGQYVFIESTAEGREGNFYEMCQRAQNNHASRKQLTNLEYRFHFFPWYKEPAYRIGSPVNMTTDDHEYFLNLKSQHIELDVEQKAWYAFKASEQKENMKREYPSTPEEAWQQSTEGCYYAKQMLYIRSQKHIGFVPYDPALEVHVAFDLGRDDPTAMWFFQIYGKEIRLIEYLEGAHESLEHWLGVVKKKDYIYGKFLAPHDINVKEYSTGISRLVSARKMGISLIAVPKTLRISGIDKVRNILNQCWFDETKCAKGVFALENYKKEWNDAIGDWRNEPLHNQWSHGADAFRTLACGLHYITGQRTQAEIERAKLEQLKDYSGQLPGSIFYEGDKQQKRSVF